MENRSNQIIDKIQRLSSQKIVFDKEAILQEYQHHETSSERTLAIKLLSIIGGLFATSSFMGFLAITGIYNSEISLVFTGLLLMLASIILNKNSTLIITDTLSITSYLVGIGLFIFGLQGLNESIISILIMLITLVTLFLVQDFILAFVSTLIFISSFFILIMLQSYNNFNSIYFFNTLIVLAMSFMYLFESKIITKNKTFSKLYDPVRIGLVVSFLVGLGALRMRYLFDFNISYTWLYSIVLFGIVIYIVSKIMKTLEIDEKRTQYFAYGISLLLLFLTAYSPSILGSFLLLLLSFYVNDKTGFYLAILMLVFSVFQYYYDLNYTLLTKSILLFGSGILFLSLYFIISKNNDYEKL